jgi:hypothetical protein
LELGARVGDLVDGVEVAAVLVVGVAVGVLHEPGTVPLDIRGLVGQHPLGGAGQRVPFLLALADLSADRGQLGLGARAVLTFELPRGEPVGVRARLGHLPIA